jgi:hypothetical protein
VSFAASRIERCVTISTVGPLMKKMTLQMR